MGRDCRGLCDSGLKKRRNLRENPRTLAVLYGGRGVDEKISEAKAMADYLLAQGLRESDCF